MTWGSVKRLHVYCDPASKGHVNDLAGVESPERFPAALAPTESWRLILSLSAIPALVVLALIVRLPDTARWLLMNGQREEAADLLRRVEPDMDPNEEVRRIEHDLSYEEKGSFAELFQGRFRKAGIFVVGLGFLVQITGINAIVYYSRRSSRRSASRVRRARSSRPASSRLRA